MRDTRSGGRRRILAISGPVADEANASPFGFWVVRGDEAPHAVRDEQPQRSASSDANDLR